MNKKLLLLLALCELQIGLNAAEAKNADEEEVVVNEELAAGHPGYRAIAREFFNATKAVHQDIEFLDQVCREFRSDACPTDFTLFLGNGVKAKISINDSNLNRYQAIYFAENLQRYAGDKFIVLWARKWKTYVKQPADHRTMRMILDLPVSDDPIRAAELQ